MTLIKDGTLQGDREQWLWFGVGSESGAVKSRALTASPAAPHTANDPLLPCFHCLTPAWQGCGRISSWGVIRCSQLTDLWKTPTGQKVVSQGNWDPTIPCKTNSSRTSCDLVQVSHPQASMCMYTRGRWCLNKQCKLAGWGLCLFSISNAREGENGGWGLENRATRFIWIEFYWGWFKRKTVCGTQIKPQQTNTDWENWNWRRTINDLSQFFFSKWLENFS